LIIHVFYEADFRENNFSANFPLVSVFQCEASRRSPLTSEWVRLRRLDSQVTCLDVRGSVVCLWHPASGRVSDASGRIPYRVKYRISALAAAPHFIFNSIFFLSFCCGFLMVSRIFSAYFVIFCPLSHFQVFCSLFYLLFSYFNY
jgi:hypothetical protein